MRPRYYIIFGKTRITFSLAMIPLENRYRKTDYLQETYKSEILRGLNRCVTATADWKNTFLPPSHSIVTDSFVNSSTHFSIIRKTACGG